MWLFPKDNNGVIVELPTVSPLGAASVSGSLVFGIGTQTNNALGSAAVFTVDGQGTFTTVYQGQSYGGSFLDTGSNGIYFLDSRTAGLPLCPDTADFYCPDLSAGVLGDPPRRERHDRRRGVRRGERRYAAGELVVFRVQPAGRSQPGKLRLGLAVLLRAERVYGHRVAKHADRLRSVLGLLRAQGCKTKGSRTGIQADFASARIR